uniref:non-specific serine/threonine protein kinase n=1 Tax=Takifugu rubripes TaxID=31033 RepID=A0A674PHE8_TAKRU
MRVLQSKGIIHRDLKPQNILLSHPPGRKSHCNNTRIKIGTSGTAIGRRGRHRAPWPPSGAVVAAIGRRGRRHRAPWPPSGAVAAMVAIGRRGRHRAPWSPSGAVAAIGRRGRHRAPWPPWSPWPPSGAVAAIGHHRPPWPPSATIGRRGRHRPPWPPSDAVAAMVAVDALGRRGRHRSPWPPWSPSVAVAAIGRRGRHRPPWSPSGAVAAIGRRGRHRPPWPPSGAVAAAPLETRARAFVVCVGHVTTDRRCPLSSADFGFARYLQHNMMAATLCGSPMYMAPEVIMSQNYDAKADLWSIGTIVFQCLTGKAPFQANSPQELRLFYEKNQTLSPDIPRETSHHLRHLLLDLLQRNHTERLDFDQFFSHPFLEPSSSLRRAEPANAVSPPGLPGSPSASSCSSSSTSHLASPPNSLAEGQQLRVRTSAHQEDGLPLRDWCGGSRNSSSCDFEDFVMVPAHFSAADLTADGLQDSLTTSGSLLACAAVGGRSKTPPRSPSCSRSAGPSRLGEVLPADCLDHAGRSLPIPVPTQRHNFQRLEQNLQSSRTDASQRPAPRGCSSGNLQGLAGVTEAPPRGPGGLPAPRGPGGLPAPRRLSLGGARTVQPSSQTPERLTLQPRGLGSRLHSAPCLLECTAAGARQKIRKQHSDPVVAAMPGAPATRPLHPSPRLSELMQRSPLPTILGSPSRAFPPFEFPRPPSSPNLLNFLTQQGLVVGSRTIPLDLRETRGDPPWSQATHYSHTRRRSDQVGGFGRSQSAGGLSDMLLKAAFGPGRAAGESVACDRTPGSLRSCSPAGSLSGRPLLAGTSPRYSFTDPLAPELGGAVMFEAPELPEETLMEQEHTDTVHNLRFTLDFAHCLVEVAGARGAGVTGTDACRGSTVQQQSPVADRISSLSRDWSHAEQLVLYLKSAELLSGALHTAMERVAQGKLYPSATVKQVVRKLNELYKRSVASCRSLSTRLERFFSRKHRLMDQICSVTAERLLFSHTVQMVQAAALDEMFHQGEASVPRYHKALLLMEGLMLLLAERDDVTSVSKCKEYIERRLTALQSGLGV